MKVKGIVAIVILALTIGISGCYDYDIHNGGYHPYWYNHGWYGGNRFDDHRGPAFGHEFGGHFGGHDNDRHEENHNEHHENRGH